MPRHRVVNRRNAAPFVRRSLSVTPDGIKAADQLAATLGVSLGSIVDAALRELIGLGPEHVVQVLVQHGHLTADERKIVDANIAAQEKRR